MYGNKYWLSVFIVGTSERVSILLFDNFNEKLNKGYKILLIIY